MESLTLFGVEEVAKPGFLEVVTTHWRFCVLHFLEFGIWGAWYVVLANLLNARGFSRTDIGRIYATIPIGSILSPLFIGYIADQYFNTEIIIGVLHLVGAVFLFLMAKSDKPRRFYWFCFIYALAYAPTLSLVNSIIFAHNDDLFDGNAENQFFWIRVFGTIGWICAGLSLKLFLDPKKPMNSSPILLAAGLSVVLGLFSFTLPETKPQASKPVDVKLLTADSDSDGSLSEDEVKAIAEDEALSGLAERADENEDGAISKAELEEFAADNTTFAAFMQLVQKIPAFLGISLVIAIAMAIYFAFAGLFVEKSGIKASNVGPVMTIGQCVEIFFLITLPVILGANNERMNMVLTIGISAWVLRFILFSIGRPLALVLFGVALHGICFDFFFATGFTYVAGKAPDGLAATAQSLYGVLVYGLGMYIGTEGSGWLNKYFSKPKEGAAVATADGESVEIELETNWQAFWAIPAIMVAISLAIFLLNGGS